MKLTQIFHLSLSLIVSIDLSLDQTPLQIEKHIKILKGILIA